jgi:hypothetical protein
VLREGRKEDPLLDSLEVLEANCAMVWDLLTHTRKAFSQLFEILFPKKKKEMPKKLAELVGVFNAPEDPMLIFKQTAMKIGAKITMALAMSHYEVVYSEKVSSSLAVDEHGKIVAIKPFLATAKKFSQKMVSLILPSSVPLTSTSPSSSTALVADTTPSEVP